MLIVVMMSDRRVSTAQQKQEDEEAVKSIASEDNPVLASDKGLDIREVYI